MAGTIHEALTARKYPALRRADADRLERHCVANRYGRQPERRWHADCRSGTFNCFDPDCHRTCHEFSPSRSIGPFAVIQMMPPAPSFAPSTALLRHRPRTTDAPRHRAAFGLPLG
jgi:hypothetical protein